MKIELIKFSDITSDSNLCQQIAGEYLYQKESFQYESIYHQNQYTDLSFAVNVDGVSVLGFPMTANENKLSFFGRPLKYFIDQTMSSEKKFEVINSFLQMLDKVLVENNITKLSFYADSVLNNHFLNHIESNQYILQGIIDLKIEEGLILRGIRKSYRSLINWGKREIRTVLVDHKNPDKKIFDEVREFHIKVSGRETRSKETWDKQFEMIEKKQAYLVVGYFNELISSAALILYGSQEAYYGVAVNDRQVMGDNKPLGHYTVYFAISHAKNLGLERFNLGPIFYSHMTEKEQQIATFKKGFVSTLESQTIFNVEISKKE